MYLVFGFRLLPDHQPDVFTPCALVGNCLVESRQESCFTTIVHLYTTVHLYTAGNGKLYCYDNLSVHDNYTLEHVQNTVHLPFPVVHF